ncbi:hypothetical protein VOLCADRAFT_107771 [Volvox carteri f. nagariensis]|uniref:UBA domain-containing protein n=1 Tax=Volvox carteri f. nagariensis TaxID=3068 RepID=D8UGA5_VOLCA|nr:uncharacterized protein VOLCADRAFT_107771 [Volvox carteri f. nagariensis]EFJ41254.1 hypothetical protein VOLCADRAFT_107771 [Volvox carteri f. nagariensis]|eukprot:XP_002957705.1 hypothetical protein VOLCADRAFT_107771 [Volvox carteri f. nagariensis]
MASGARGIGGLGLKVTGALSGTVFVESLDCTVGSLRTEISRLMGGDAVVKMIVGGRTLQDDSRTLHEAGVTATSRILVTRGSSASSDDGGVAAVNTGADRARRLEWVRKAAEALAARDSRGLSDDYALDVENQSGSSVAVRPEDRRNLVLGLVLHDKAKATLKRGDYATALEELLLAEEALALCDPSLTSAIDNLPLLLIDLVWAAYKLRDVRRLAVSKERLAKARAGLARAHGPRLERLRNLTGAAFSPELATYLRLEVLEGLVGYYSGESRTAVEGSFRAAQAKWRRLQVSDEALALLQGMGYELQESRRGLRLSGGDVTAAVDFILEQRKAEAERNARRKRVSDWNHERIKYGKTPSGEYVDPDQLDRLTGLGYERRLAAEALRKNGNKGQEALDELSSPERRRALELGLALKEGLEATHFVEKQRLTGLARATVSFEAARTQGAPGDEDSKQFAIAIARVVDEVKCSDIVVLDVAPGMILIIRITAQDFGDVVLHLFTNEQREYYDIESFYAAAEEVELPFGQPDQGAPSGRSESGSGQSSSTSSNPTWSTKI